MEKEEQKVSMEGTVRIEGGGGGHLVIHLVWSS